MHILRIVGAFGFLEDGRWLRSQSDSNFIGGTQIQSYMLTSELAKLGVKQDVFTRNAENKKIAIKNVSFFSCGIHGDLFFPLYACLYARKKKYDAIHVHMGISPFMAISGFLLKKLTKTPLICTVNLSWDKIKGLHFLHAAFAKFVENYVLSRADAVVTLYPKEVEKYCIPDGVQSIFFSPKITQKRESYMLFVGRKTYQKGLEFLTEAFQKSLLAKQGISLVIIVNSKENLTFKTPEGITLIENPTRQEIVEFMSKAMSLVVPSRFEERGTVIAEALATGTQVLVSDLPNIREAYKEAPKNSIFYFPLTVEDLRKTLKIFVDTNQHGEIDREKIRTFATQYHERRMTSRYYGLYQKVTHASL